MTESLAGCVAPQVSTCTEPAPCEVQLNHTSRLWLAWQVEAGAVAVIGVAKRVSATAVVLPAVSTVAVAHSSLAGGGTTKLHVRVNAPAPVFFSDTRMRIDWFGASAKASLAASGFAQVALSSLQASSVPPQASNTEMTVSPVALPQVSRFRVPASAPPENEYHTSLPVASQLEAPSLVAFWRLPVTGDVVRAIALAQALLVGGAPISAYSSYWYVLPPGIWPPKNVLGGVCWTPTPAITLITYQSPATTGADRVWMPLAQRVTNRVVFAAGVSTVAGQTPPADSFCSWA